MLQNTTMLNVLSLSAGMLLGFTILHPLFRQRLSERTILIASAVLAGVGALLIAFSSSFE